MRLIVDPSAFNECFGELLRKHSQFSMAVAWASTSFSGYHALLRERTKLSRVVVGIHFYQTHPDFIQTFLTDPRVRFCINPTGVFHPKLYLFESNGNNWACLLGSENFTTGGFGYNDESFVFVSTEDDPDGTVHSALVTAIEDYWQKGRQLTRFMHDPRE